MSHIIWFERKSLEIVPADSRHISSINPIFKLYPFAVSPYIPIAKESPLGPQIGTGGNMSDSQAWRVPVEG